jgi:hypothetical protein
VPLGISRLAGDLRIAGSGIAQDELQDSFVPALPGRVAVSAHIRLGSRSSHYRDCASSWDPRLDRASRRCQRDNSRGSTDAKSRHPESVQHQHAASRDASQGTKEFADVHVRYRGSHGSCVLESVGPGGRPGRLYVISLDEMSIRFAWAQGSPL